MCRVLKVARSAYYQWLKAKPGKRMRLNEELTERITQAYHASKQSYGSPRIHAALCQQGVSVSRPRVARLMKKAGIAARRPRKYRTTTDSRHDYPIAENVLNRCFAPGAVAERWVSDITYIRTLQGWAYLTIILDIGDRSIIGWHVSTSLKAQDTVIPALYKALARRPIRKELLFHSDRGVQYACKEFKDRLLSSSLVSQSMSRKGNCWDNAVAESFFKTMKQEWTDHHSYVNVTQAAMSIFEYIETFYNTRRKHSALGYQSPKEYKQNLHSLTQAA
jgi:putative transposase